VGVSLKAYDMKVSRIRSIHSKKIEAKFPSTRFITIGLWPGFGGKKACIRLQGKWLRDAGFIPRWQVKVTVTEGKLVLEPIKPTERYLG
jgi:hypothetical protein